MKHMYKPNSLSPKSDKDYTPPYEDLDEELINDLELHIDESAYEK